MAQLATFLPSPASNCNALARKRSLFVAQVCTPGLLHSMHVLPSLPRYIWTYYVVNEPGAISPDCQKKLQSASRYYYVCSKSTGNELGSGVVLERPTTSAGPPWASLSPWRGKSGWLLLSECEYAARPPARPDASLIKPVASHPKRAPPFAGASFFRRLLC